MPKPSPTSSPPRPPQRPAGVRPKRPPNPTARAKAMLQGEAEKAARRKGNDVPKPARNGTGMAKQGKPSTASDKPTKGAGLSSMRPAARMGWKGHARLGMPPRPNHAEEEAEGEDVDDVDLDDLESGEEEGEERDEYRPVPDSEPGDSESELPSDLEDDGHHGERSEPAPPRADAWLKHHSSTSYITTGRELTAKELWPTSTPRRPARTGVMGLEASHAEGPPLLPRLSSMSSNSSDARGSSTGPLSTAPTSGYGSEGRLQMAPRTRRSLSPSSRGHEGPEEPPRKKKKYGKPRVADYAEADQEVISRSCEYFKVSLLSTGPYKAKEDEFQLAVESWVEACHHLNVGEIKWSNDIIRLHMQKISQLTNQFKNEARVAVLTVNTRVEVPTGTWKVHVFQEGGAHEASNKALATKLLEGDSFTFRDPDVRLGVYQAASISRVICRTMFRGCRDVGPKYASIFNPIPKEVIALAATAVEHCIREWESGQYISQEFTHVAAAEFERHMDNLLSFRDQFPDSLAALQVYLWKTGCHSAKADKLFAEKGKKSTLSRQDFMHGALTLDNVAPTGAGSGLSDVRHHVRDEGDAGHAFAGEAPVRPAAEGAGAE